MVYHIKRFNTEEVKQKEVCLGSLVIVINENIMVLKCVMIISNKSIQVSNEYVLLE